jgi:hypothetical protein
VIRKRLILEVGLEGPSDGFVQGCLQASVQLLITLRSHFAASRIRTRTGGPRGGRPPGDALPGWPIACPA